MLIKGDLHSMDYLLDALNDIKKNLRHNNPICAFDTQMKALLFERLNYLFNFFLFIWTCLMIYRYRCSQCLPARAAIALSLKEQKWLIADLYTSVLEVSYFNAPSHAQRSVENNVFVNENLL